MHDVIACAVLFRYCIAVIMMPVVMMHISNILCLYIMASMILSVWCRFSYDFTVLQNHMN